MDQLLTGCASPCRPSGSFMRELDSTGADVFTQISTLLSAITTPLTSLADTVSIAPYVELLRTYWCQ